jgi:hypothetical protein
MKPTLGVTIRGGRLGFHLVPDLGYLRVRAERDGYFDVDIAVDVSGMESTGRKRVEYYAWWEDPELAADLIAVIRRRIKVDGFTDRFQGTLTFRDDVPVPR